MKVSREQAERNRDRIIEVASRLFRERGFDGVGVADLMKAAGLTHGGFYGHFESKDDLAAEACARSLAHSAAKWEDIAAAAKDDAFAALVRTYLSGRHRESPGASCALAALGTDTARHGRAVKRAYARGLEALVAILARAAPGRGSSAAKRRKALAAMAEMAGAVMLARAVGDAGLAREIVAAVEDDLTGKA